MAEFEVAVYNADVRACVADQRRHRDLNDKWADIHYIEIKADSLEQARDKAQHRYPERRGYVIEAVTEIKEF
jgi:hypothetical protein